MLPLAGSSTVPKRVPILGTGSLWGSLLVPIGSQFIFQGSIFSVSWVHLRKESEFSLSIQKLEKTHIIDYRSVYRSVQEPKPWVYIFSLQKFTLLLKKDRSQNPGSIFSSKNLVNYKGRFERLGVFSHVMMRSFSSFILMKKVYLCTHFGTNTNKCQEVCGHLSVGPRTSFSVDKCQ